jgi:hypothetical protein
MCKQVGECLLHEKGSWSGRIVFKMDQENISVCVCVRFYYKLHYKGCIYKCVYYFDVCAN